MRRRTLSLLLCAAVSLEPAAIPATVLGAVLAAGAAAQETASGRTVGAAGRAAPQIGAAESGTAIRISPGDVVSITVFPATEYSREVTVQPDGKIELSLLGDVLVKGLSPRELQDLLREKYARYVENPQITISVRKFSGRRVAILGEVKSPGFYEYRDGMKLLELVSLAGGLSDNAKPSKSRILRYAGTEAGTSVRVNFQAVLDGDLKRDVALVPGDTVYIPKGKFTIGAQWTNNNILPWATLMTVIASIVVVIKTNTGP